MVTHDDDVAAAAERIARMKDGKVISTNDEAPGRRLVGERLTRPPPAPAMSLVTYLVRAQLRRRWRVWLGLVALIAIGGGTPSSRSPRGSERRRPWTASSRPSTPATRSPSAPASTGTRLVAQPAILDADSGEYFFLVPNDATGPDTDPPRRRQPVQLRVRPDACTA